MTLEELLELPASDLEKISDAELEAFFEPYLNVTRPDRAAVEKAKTNVTKKIAKGAPAEDIGRAKAFAFMAQLGVDVDDL